MKIHLQPNAFIPGTRPRSQPELKGSKSCHHERPTLSEQGIDVDRFIANHKEEIQRMREETDWTAYAADIAKLRAHRPQEPMPQLDEQGEPTGNEPVKPRKKKPARDIMHPDDKTCEAWSKLTPNRLTAEQAKAVSDWRARQRLLDYWTRFMAMNGRQPTAREAKTALHIGSETFMFNVKRLRKENKIPAARKPGGMKDARKETATPSKKPVDTGDSKAAKQAKTEDYGDYGNPARQIERYIRALDDFAAETIRISRTQYEVIKDKQGFVFSNHNSLNVLIDIRHDMVRLLKALKTKELS